EMARYAARTRDENEPERAREPDPKTRDGAPGDAANGCQVPVRRATGAGQAAPSPADTTHTVELPRNGATGPDPAATVDPPTAAPGR
ncbi:MAG: hypothetical protein ACRDRV_13105, partial [Pseudonocardiaceae bacterium]